MWNNHMNFHLISCMLLQLENMDRRPEVTIKLYGEAWNICKLRTHKFYVVQDENRHLWIIQMTIEPRS